MNQFIVSDLHLVDGGPRDPFAYGDRLAQFNDFLDFVEKHSGRLFLAGDVLDLWRGNFSKATQHYAKLLDRLADMGAIYVVGNHDCDLKYFIGGEQLAHPIFKRLSGPIILDGGRKRIKIQHGHEADVYCAQDMPGMSRIMAIMSGQIEERNGSTVWHGYEIEDLFLGVLEKLVSFHEWFWGKKPRNEELTLGLKTAVDTGNCDIVIGGHTHEPGRIGDWYYNSGSWCTTRPNTFVWINDSNEVQVFDWAGGPVPNNIVLA